ncbi:2Fe-2S iron-sulfur cluster-binding protein [Aminobacter sp. MSH1]|uniref:2Fe-2S iron-sulfur cluster-binding protein n=1 Tax=Aminobacter sp. MSH1 TaxID=374606 RepID=UPI000D376C96|nr:2Fe-2S iron-sulfur cluster-binding protein [Aminobacter sp. MSH1]
MPTITFHDVDGQVIGLDVRDGQSLMEAAIRHGVAGILAECGGSCMCATCHVYIEAGPIKELPPMSDDEDIMLGESIAERRLTSRLSCQIRANDKLNGLVVQIADNGL